MITLLIYLSCLIIGGLVGHLLKTKGKQNLKYLGKVQFILIIILTVTMGIGIGIDNDVFSSLPIIGLFSLIIGISMLIFTVLFIFISRKILRINKKGEIK